MKHDTSSATEEDAESMKGCGIRGLEDPSSVGLTFLSPAFRASYVVKNAPAAS